MDLSTSENGDILIQGDVVQLSLAESIGQRIDHLLRSKPGDWEQNLAAGAYLQQYVGYPNVPSTKTIVEEELNEEFANDFILRNFEIIVEYTPTSMNTAQVEITARIPDGNDVVLVRDLNPAEGVNKNSGLPFTPAEYDSTIEVLRKELVTSEEETNVFEIEHVPINDLIFIKDFVSGLALDENGELDLPELVVSQTVDFVSGLVSGVSTTGDPFSIPSGAIDQRNYLLQPYVKNVIENKLVSRIDVTVDGVLIDTEDFSIDDNKFTLLEPYTENVDGEIIFHGVNDIPSDNVILDMYYYDSYPILNVQSFDQESVPNSLFPRNRLTDKTFIVTKQPFEPGTYFIQYLSYKLTGEEDA